MTAALSKQLKLPTDKRTFRPWQLKLYVQRLERELLMSKMTIERLRQKLDKQQVRDRTRTGP